MQAASPLHVLVIDDHRTMRKIIARCLREIGITAIADADNGAEALAWLAMPNNDPDVIICDLHMGEMDGLEFCNLVRRGKGLRDPNIPILLLTGGNRSLRPWNRPVDGCGRCAQPADLLPRWTFTVSPIAAPHGLNERLRPVVSVRSGRGMGAVKRISHVEARPHKVLSFCW